MFTYKNKPNGPDCKCSISSAYLLELPGINLRNIAIIMEKKMYLTMYLFLPDPVQNLVPGGRYKVLRSTLYREVGTRYSKVPCTWEQVQGTRKYLIPTNRYKVQEVPCT